MSWRPEPASGRQTTVPLPWRCGKLCSLRRARPLLESCRRHQHLACRRLGHELPAALLPPRRASMYRWLIRPVLFRLPAEWAHTIAFGALRLLHRIPGVRHALRAAWGVDEGALGV